MRTLHKHILDPKKALNFFKESLEKTNLLSNEIVKQAELKKGIFFTLLPEEADLKNLHEFNRSILPQTPLQKGVIGSLQGIHTYSVVPSLEEEICAHILKKAKKKQFYCVTDNFNDTYQDNYQCDLFDKFGMFYKEEIYYLFNLKNVAKKYLLEGLYRSKTFWHSLCLIIQGPLKLSPEKNLSLQAVEEICKNTRYVMIGAYDGEGYLFWEKTM